MMNNKNIGTETFSTIKHTIAKNDYLFFYIKIDQIFMPNSDSSDSDCNNTGKRIRYLSKKLIQKRNYVLEKDKKVETYFISRTVPFKTKCCSTEKFGTKWEEKNQTLLKFITDGSCTRSRKTRFQMDTILNGHNPEWTQFRMDTISNRHHPESTPSQMDTIPDGHQLFIK